MGCSTAYHLAERCGISNVAVLEQATLTSGTTWHAAGLISQLKGTLEMCEFAQYTRALCDEFEADPDLGGIGWHPSGSVGVARDADTMEQLARATQLLKDVGVETRVVGPAEIQALHPLLDLEGVVGGVHIPSDGYVNPTDFTMRFAALARRRGVAFHEHAQVASIERDPRDPEHRVASVTTTDGRRFACENLVIAAGQWTPQVAAMAGVPVPVATCPHQVRARKKSRNEGVA